MTRLSISALLSLSLLTACPGSGKKDTLSDDDVAMLGTAADLPPATAFLAMFLFPFMASAEMDCPTITEDDDGTLQIEGDCTDTEGQTWSGSASVGGTGVTWNEFDIFGLTLDGTQTMGLDGSLVTNMTLDGDMGDGVQLTYAYTDHTVTNYMSFFSAAFEGGPYDYAVSGGVSVGELGDFTIESTVAHTGTCEYEPDSGSQTLTGPFTIVFTYDGAENCDGCIPWTSGDQSGEFCRDIGGDTGSWDTGDWDTGW